MASGNPAKAARKRTIDEVRQAVKDGKTAVLTPWPGTEVTIRSNNPTYAESVVSFIEIMDPKSRDLAHVHALTHMFTLFFTAYASDPKNTKPLAAWLNQAQKDLAELNSTEEVNQ